MLGPLQQNQHFFEGPTLNAFLDAPHPSQN